MDTVHEHQPPMEIRLKKNRRTLSVAFSAADIFSLPAEYLRVQSPSAEVKGHGPGQEVLVYGKKDVSITSLEPVGEYALKIIFSDGHSTGLYTWTYLKELGQEMPMRWQAYLEKLEEQGKSRDVA